MPELNDDDREVIGGMRVVTLVLVLVGATVAIGIGVGIGFLSALLTGG